MREESYRRTLTRLVTFLAGLYFFLEFLLPKSVLEAVGVTADVHSSISTGFIVVGTMAFGLGIINLFRVHGTKVVFRRKDWLYSLALLFGLAMMMSITGLDWLSGLAVTQRNAEFRHLGMFSEVIIDDTKQKKEGVPERDFRVQKLLEAVIARAETAKVRSDELSETIPLRLEELAKVRYGEISEELSVHLAKLLSTESADVQDDVKLAAFGKYITDTGVLYEKILRFQYDQSLVKKLYLFFFEGLFVSLGSAMFSLLGVYIASAAYRAFRIKSIESLLMMTAAILVMLGQIPFYEYISHALPDIRQWLLEVPNTAAFRAIKIGAAIAGLVMAFRMWFSIESESFSPRGNSSSGGKG